MENEDPVVKEIRLLSQRVDMLIQRLHETVVSSRVKNYTFGDLQNLVGYYSDEYLANIGTTHKPSPRTWKAAKVLLQAMPIAEAKACIDEAFDDTFFCENIKELHHISNNINKYRKAPPPTPPPVVAHTFLAPWDDTRETPDAVAVEDINQKLGL